MARLAGGISYTPPKRAFEVLVLALFLGLFLPPDLQALCRVLRFAVPLQLPIALRGFVRLEGPLRAIYEVCDIRRVLACQPGFLRLELLELAATMEPFYTPARERGHLNRG